MRPRGNPNWGKWAPVPVPRCESAWDRQLYAHGLTEAEALRLLKDRSPAVASLRDWIFRRGRYSFVPESALEIVCMNND